MIFFLFLIFPFNFIYLFMGQGGVMYVGRIDKD